MLLSKDKIYCFSTLYLVAVLASWGQQEDWPPSVQGNQEPRLEDPRWAWGDQVRGMWLVQCCDTWFGDRKYIRPV